MLGMAMTPSEYSVAGSQVSSITVALVSYVNTWLAVLVGCGLAELDAPLQAASSRASAEPDANSSPARWGFMDASVVLVGDWAAGAVGQGAVAGGLVGSG